LMLFLHQGFDVRQHLSIFHGEPPCGRNNESSFMGLSLRHGECGARASYNTEPSQTTRLTPRQLRRLICYAVFGIRVRKNAERR